MLGNFGKVDYSTRSDKNSFILRFVHESLHNSFVTFKIDATDIQYVYNRVSGRIIYSGARDFVAIADEGFLLVTIENTGQIAGDFMVTLVDCQDNRVPSSEVVSLLPGEVANVTFIFQVYVKKKTGVSCIGTYHFLRSCVYH